MRFDPIDASAFCKVARDTIGGELPFGRVFSTHMVQVEYDELDGWHGGRVVPREPMAFDPAAMCFHYGQTAFEGLKAHRQENGEVVVFRLQAHAERMQRTCERLCIPAIEVDDFVGAVQALVTTDYAWVPDKPGTSLYLRPTMVATEPALGVRPSQRYLFFVLGSPTGPYFADGFSGIRVAVERQMSRVAPGGLGNAKAGANYVASLLAAERAKQRGCAQVLWLDATEHRWVEETGASNLFWVQEGVVTTPPLSDTILQGITRDSILRLAPRLDLPVREAPICIDDMIQAIRAGRITEVFGSGTAAVVTPIRELCLNGDVVTVGDGHPGPVSRALLDAITSIHRGRAADPFGWCTLVPRPSWFA